MGDVMLALRRSVSTLARGRVWLYMLAPAIVAVIVMVGLSLALLERLIADLIEQPPLSWVVAWGAFWLAKLLAALGGWLLILSASYLVALLLTAIVVLPLLLNHLAADPQQGLSVGQVFVFLLQFFAANQNYVWRAYVHCIRIA